MVGLIAQNESQAFLAFWKGDQANFHVLLLSWPTNSPGQPMQSPLFKSNISYHKVLPVTTLIMFRFSSLFLMVLLEGCNFLRTCVAHMSPSILINKYNDLNIKRDKRDESYWKVFTLYHWNRETNFVVTQVRK